MNALFVSKDIVSYFSGIPFFTLFSRWLPLRKTLVIPLQYVKAKCYPSIFLVFVSEVGPGASKEGKYKNPEYFCYSDMSYFNADKEMLKFRLPQPSPKN